MRHLISNLSAINAPGWKLETGSAVAACSCIGPVGAPRSEDSSLKRSSRNNSSTVGPFVRSSSTSREEAWALTKSDFTLAQREGVILVCSTIVPISRVNHGNTEHTGKEWPRGDARMIGSSNKENQSSLFSQDCILAHVNRGTSPDPKPHSEPHNKIVSTLLNWKLPWRSARSCWKF